MDFKGMLLKNLYDNDFCYIARDYNGELFAYKLEPFKYDKKWENCGVNDFHALNEFNDLFPEIKWEDDEPFKINKPIDWSKVPVDTKVLVRDEDTDTWEKSYFCGYRPDSSPDYPFVTFGLGATSWSAEETEVWKQCKLAEGADE